MEWYLLKMHLQTGLNYLLKINIIVMIYIELRIKVMKIALKLYFIIEL